jgi:hypothetical protein
MFVRLAFAVAVAGQPDLLIVDEALAVGDIFFRQKCYARLREMREKGMAVILVTHSSGDAQEFCDRAILLEQGRQTYIGDPQETMLRYYISMQGTGQAGQAINENTIDQTSNAAVELAGSPWPHLEQHFLSVPLEKQQCISGAWLVRYCLTDDNDCPGIVFKQGSVMKVYGEYRLEFPVKIPATGVTICSSSGIVVYSKGTAHLGITCEPVTHVPTTIFTCHEITLDIACGEYTLSFGLSSVNPEVYTKREYYGFEEWAAGSHRLVSVVELSSISIILPFSRSPSKVRHFGLVDLPSKVSLAVCS